MNATWRQMYDNALQQLTDAGVDSPAHKLRWWISDRLNCGLTQIPYDTVPSDAEIEGFHAALAQLVKHMPVQYVCGTAPFREFDVKVTPNVLIPRPETEQLLEIALDAWIRGGDAVADIGTGSGCIAIAVKRALPSCKVRASDFSSAALAVARQNAEDNEAEIRLFESDLLTAYDDGSIDVVIANLPYVSDAEMAELPRDVREYEPEMALRGGKDGTELIARLLADAQRVCRPGGRILLETGESHGHVIYSHAEASGWRALNLTDGADRPRFWILQRNESHGEIPTS